MDALAGRDIGLDGVETRAINRDLDTAARRFRQEPALRRREMLEKLARKTDLDLGEVRTFLTNEGRSDLAGCEIRMPTRLCTGL